MYSNTFKEHQQIELVLTTEESLSRDSYTFLFPKKKEDQICYEVYKTGERYFLKSGYFIGVDWLETGIKHIQINPKLNFNSEGEEFKEVNYLNMLCNCLKHQEAADLISELIHIKWDEPQINLQQKNDTLTPFIIVDFLNVVKQIVKKGLKKSYYKTTQTLNARIKGKLLIKETIAIQIKTGTMVHNNCMYEEFGVNIQENKLLKKTLDFIQQYMGSSPILKEADYINEMLNFIAPPFEAVSSNIELYEIKQLTSNTLFKEYDKAIKLAKLILRRFAFNISNTSTDSIPTPPFWIDMPMLFELHVLSLLKEKYGTEVTHHLSTYGNELDFLLSTKGKEMVIDAKYKPSWHHNINHNDVRQVCGYSRLKRVFEVLSFKEPKLLDCLIIYPVLSGSKNIQDDLKQTEVESYSGIYKIGIELP